MFLSRLLRKTKEAPSVPFRITLTVLAEIRDTVGTLPAEHGGVLGGPDDNSVVTEFYFDQSARRSTVSYTPDNQLLNRLFSTDWNPRNVRLKGFVHSHPGLRELSNGDIDYSKRILERIPDLERLITPIVISAGDAGRFEILPYAVVRKGEHVEVVSLDMRVLDAEGRTVVDWEEELRSPVTIGDTVTPPAVIGAGGMTDKATGATVGGALSGPDTHVTEVPSSKRVPEFFQRVVHAYDLNLMGTSRVVYVGTGGSSGLIEDVARAGVGQHVLIDPDVVNEPNLATQQTYHRDIGRPKVDAIADRIRDINPAALVVPLHRSLDDITDQEFELLVQGQTDRWPVSRSLICGYTDSFYAQARVNRLALHLGLPSLCAQIYEEGRGAEVTFTHPDVTPACHRCALNSRYKAYLDGAFQNTVTSDGAPVFSTTRVNALNGFLAMALLHHGTAHPRWGHLLERIGNRNLVQVRMDPDLSSTIGLRVFDRVFQKAEGDRILFDETLWLPQQPEGPASDVSACPDCGGTGNLRDSIGTFADTRVMRKEGDSSVAANVRVG